MQSCKEQHWDVHKEPKEHPKEPQYDNCLERQSWGKGPWEVEMEEEEMAKSDIWGWYHPVPGSN